MIRGCLILLLLTTVAIVWHNIDQESLRGALATKQSPDLHGIATAPFPKGPREAESQRDAAEPRNDLLSLFPEQRFLIDGPFDINTATVEELEAIPYIGPSMARKISEFRDKHGLIARPEELLEINGVGPRILERIGPYIKCGTVAPAISF